MEEKFQSAMLLINRSVTPELFDRYIVHSAENKIELWKRIKTCDTQGIPRFSLWRILLDVIPVDGDWEAKKEAL